MNTLLTTLIGLGAGILQSWIAASFDAKRQRDDALFRAAGLLIEDRNSARKIRTKEFQFTRRVIALSFTFAFVLAPVLWAFVYPTATMTVPVIGQSGGFLSILLPWVDSKEVVEYIQVPVMVYVLTLLDMFGLIIGFYFGSGGTRSRG